MRHNPRLMTKLEAPGIPEPIRLFLFNHGPSARRVAFRCHLAYLASDHYKNKKGT